MNFKQASLQQLYQIASPFEECTISYKLQAKAEIERRKKIRHPRKQYRRKEMSG